MTESGVIPINSMPFEVVQEQQSFLGNIPVRLSFLPHGSPCKDKVSLAFLDFLDSFILILSVFKAVDNLRGETHLYLLS
jgi:hypothetical protein